MLIVGLTGSIGTGKSTIAAMFTARGVSVFDADAAVHDLYDNEPKAIYQIAAAFPNALVEGRIDRARLSAHVQADAANFRRLEAIVHPLVREAEGRFLNNARKNGEFLAILEIPLLFETGSDARVDAVIVTTAPPDVVRKRVMTRSGMSAEKLDAILANQMPDSEKCALADYVVETGSDLKATERQVHEILMVLKKRGADNSG